MTSKSYQGRLSIYISGNFSNENMVLTIEDGSSRTQFIEVRIKSAKLMAALAGRSDMPCEFQLTADNVGKIAESKTVIVTIPYGRDADRSEVQRAVEAYQVDGWMARESDVSNHHNLIHGSLVNGYAKVRVIYERFTEALE